jgi:nicotinate-nucleotide adenylyltransferase
LELRYPEHQFQLCIGSDIIPQLPKWKSWEQISNRFEPIILGRGGYGEGEEDISFPKVSSTAIRRSLEEGDLPRQFLLSSVASAIEEHNTYLLSKSS